MKSDELRKRADETDRLAIVSHEAADEIDHLANRVAELEAELSRLCDVLGEDDVAIVHTLLG